MMSKLAGRVLLAVAVIAAVGFLLSLADPVSVIPVQVVVQAQNGKAVLPVFEVDAKFPQLPEKMLMGGVGGVAADSHGNVWAHHRPFTLEEGHGTDTGMTPGPPILEWDENGKFIRGFGGPSPTKEYQWFGRSQPFRSPYAECELCGNDRRGNGDRRPGQGEHGIFVDYKDNVWVTGNGTGDGQVLKFSNTGKFLLQIGHGGRKGPPVPGAGATMVDSNDTENVSASTTVAVYPKTNEVFVSDGYGNRRVIVFDADTGKYKRHWGAYGNKPDDKATKDRSLEGPGQPQFNTPHGITISDDGTVYVADRQNNRVQAFTIDGKFLKEGYVDRGGKVTGTTYGVALSRDPQQRFLYIADGANERVSIMDRNTLEYIGNFGRLGSNAGQFFHLHSLSTDPKGNILTGESQGYRVQKFIYKGLSNGQK
jgi:hypothetical protein